MSTCLQKVCSERRVIDLAGRKARRCWHMLEDFRSQWRCCLVMMPLPSYGVTQSQTAVASTQRAKTRGGVIVHWPLLSQIECLSTSWVEPWSDCQMPSGLLFVPFFFFFSLSLYRGFRFKRDKFHPLKTRTVNEIYILSLVSFVWLPSITKSAVRVKFFEINVQWKYMR